MKTISKFLVLIIFGSVLFTGCQGRTSSESSDSIVTAKIPESGGGTIAHFDKVIGELRGGQIVMVADADELKASWQKVVNEQVKPGISFTRIWIVAEADGYFLRGNDTINHASSIIRLVRNGDKIYELKLDDVKQNQAGSETVTCAGCASPDPDVVGECEVHYMPEEGFYCSDCSVGSCQKTHTVVIGHGIL